MKLASDSTSDIHITDIATRRICIVVSDWNSEVTHKLLRDAISTLTSHGINESNIFVRHVPGSFELVYGAKYMMDKFSPSAVIVLGCVVQGDTPHFDYVCAGVTQGIAALNAEGTVPIIFGVLTTHNQQQALDRAGGQHSNKGEESALTALRMIW